LAATLVSSLAASVQAAPRHDFCADLGGSFAFGVSTYGDLRDWAPTAEAEYGADFRLLYVYVLAGGMDDPDNFEQWYVRPMIETTQQMGAIPVLTFYQLLDLGRAAGYTGTEAEVVQQGLEDPAVMKTYFDHFIWLLEIAETYPPPVVVHVEPDSWGFMMWAMGVEGNSDASSVEVMVSGSGHPDVQGFADDAGGLGKALLALRDQYAPSVRLGWHASNFRVGTHPEVVTRFYSAMGEWDLLVGERPHLEQDGVSWWEPWDETLLDTNLTWLSEVVASAEVPLVFWQTSLGDDWHLLENSDESGTLARFAQAGAVSWLFEHIAWQGETDPDEIRAEGSFGEVPPTDSPAGGTARDMRTRVARYSQSPLAWPDASICDRGGSAPSRQGQAGAGSVPQAVAGAGPEREPEASGNGGAGASSNAARGEAGTMPEPIAEDETARGCGCRVTGSSGPRSASAWLVGLALGAALLRRNARRPGRQWSR
jgi:MYXO-CTERM domain-containing protein